MATASKHRLSALYEANPGLEPLVNKIKADRKRLKDKVKLVWLIGSHAKGTAREDSDTDLLIVQHQDNLEDWKGELRYLSKSLPGVKLQTHQLLSDQWEKIKHTNSCFYRGIVNTEDHIEVINNA
jgi:predicted nucleotidyltransferase